VGKKNYSTEIGMGTFLQELFRQAAGTFSTSRSFAFGQELCLGEADVVCVRFV